MHKTLMRKELRQCVPLCVLMWLACVGMAWWLQLNLSEYSVPPIPFESDSYFFGQHLPVDAMVANFLMLAGLLAIALGLVQSAWEQVGNTWAFLLHRPISRQSVLCSKMIAGISLLMLASALPLGLYAVWAALPGTHPSPFGWWIVTPTVRCWLTLPVLYLAAFQSGLLHSRWHGTRLLPICAAAGCCFGLALLPAWWVTGFPLLCVLLWLQWNAVNHTFLTRDF